VPLSLKLNSKYPSTTNPQRDYEETNKYISVKNPQYTQSQKPNACLVPSLPPDIRSKAGYETDPTPNKPH
jgi:hypothetical protein